MAYRIIRYVICHSTIHKIAGWMFSSQYFFILPNDNMQRLAPCTIYLVQLVCDFLLLIVLFLFVCIFSVFYFIFCFLRIFLVINFLSLIRWSASYFWVLKSSNILNFLRFFLSSNEDKFDYCYLFSLKYFYSRWKAISWVFLCFFILSKVKILRF